MNVTVRVPDGIVIASDSLASQQNPLQLPPLSVAHHHKCGSCGHEEDLGLAVQAPAIGVPSNSSPFANKLFYIGQFGVSFHGAAGVGGRTLCNHVLNYVHTDFAPSKTVREVAEDLSTILHDALKKQIGDLSKIPDGATALGFQIAGYNPTDLDSGSTYLVAIGREKKIEDTSGPAGVAFGGVVDVADRIYRKILPTDNVSLELMTLPDAVDYARFLIRTTADYQRFAKMVPVVGGPIDIAVITKWAGFRWVQRKTLLGTDEVRLNVGKVAEEMRTLSRKQDDLTRVVEELLASDNARGADGASGAGDVNGTPQLAATGSTLE